LQRSSGYALWDKFFAQFTELLTRSRKAAYKDALLVIQTTIVVQIDITIAACKT
jgi:hypothetical protein